MTRCWGKKVAQMFPQLTPKNQQQFLHYLIFFKIAQKSAIFLDYFCKWNCCQELSKIVQFGHTGEQLDADIGSETVALSMKDFVQSWRHSIQEVDAPGSSDEFSKSYESTASGTGQYGPHSVYLIITAVPMQPAYTAKDQMGPFEETFVTRHLANCTYSMIDEISIPFLGYLPQVSSIHT